MDNNIKLTSGNVTSLEELYDMQRQLKHCRKSFVTNYNIMPSDMQKYIDSRRVLYEFAEGKWLTVLIKKFDFYRVYYFIVDMDGYKILLDKSDLVCEIFSTDGMENENYNDEISLLTNLGFNKYNTYHRWVCRQLPNHLDYEEFPEVGISYNPDREMLEQICQYFDKYADYVPNMMGDGYKNFCNENKFVKLFDKNNKEWIGVYTYPATKNVVDWGFMLINEKYRGKGYGGYIKRVMLYECYKNSVKKCRAWVKDDNISSKKIHEKCGYQLDKIKKVVFLKCASK